MSAELQLGIADNQVLDRQVALARPVLLVLALAYLLAKEPRPASEGAVLFVAAYAITGFMLLLDTGDGRQVRLRLPVALDLVGIALVFFLTPSLVPFWLVYLLVTFAAGTQWGIRKGMATAVFLATAAVARMAISPQLLSGGKLEMLTVGLGTIISGTGMAWLGETQRRHFAADQFLRRVSNLVQAEKGLAESIRQVLDEIAGAFHCEGAYLAFRDEDLDRLFVWKVRAGSKEPISPESLPLARADAFLADRLDANFCWNSLSGEGQAFGWDRETGRQCAALPRPPGLPVNGAPAESLLAVVLESSGRAVGRLLLLRGRSAAGGRFAPRDLRWLEQIMAAAGPQLENVFLLRHIRARAVEAERSRISRDLHDGILQTLLSLNIQLGVLRQNPPASAEQAAVELESLQKTVRQESEELRRIVTDLRPLRIESADLPEMMYGFAERYRTESGLAVDLFLNGRDVRAPDRVCRELFQIYRESLHNIKKHARASHVVVKLGQDESKVYLTVDDNGQGFSFAGRYSSEELDELRLGPISIKERTRSVGGTLTVESNPGHGARLTVEIPLT